MRAWTKPGADEVLAAVRAHCLACSGGSRKEVEQCWSRECALYPYRSLKAIGQEKQMRNLKGQICMWGVGK